MPLFKLINTIWYSDRMVLPFWTKQGSENIDIVLDVLISDQKKVKRGSAGKKV